MNNIKIDYRNPFPVTAVANFNNSDQNSFIVETTVIKEMKKVINNWLSCHNGGVTIAIQGEYGTGKTQLAIETKKYIEEIGNIKYHFVCLDSPSISFLEMYKNRFLNVITKKQVLERLEEYYLEIIVADLKKNEIYQDIMTDSNKPLKSSELIERFGLPKSKYDRILQRDLEEITGNAKFVPALLLLMLPQFEEDIWNWLNGSDATEALKERMVNFVIDSDILALEAIGVFLFLFGKKEHKLILFIDEMEKIMSNPQQNQNDIFDALKKLFETVKAADSLLILCGLPDYYEALPIDAKQRIGYELKTRSVTLTEIKKYILKANQSINNMKEIVPFSTEILKNILDISSGNIRTIIRLLYHSSNWYIENGEVIGEKALHQILRDAYGTFDRENLILVLKQMIISRGWRFEENKIIEEQGKNVQIDIWIPTIWDKERIPKIGIEIYVFPNIVSDEEYTIVCDKISIDTSGYKMLIVEGFISQKYENVLSKKVQMIIGYKNKNFKELFLSVIEGEKIKSENEASNDNILMLNEKIENMHRMISRMWGEMSDNLISKKEFYYFMRKLTVNEDDDFYVMPDKESEFFLIINEIQKIIEQNNRVTRLKIFDIESGIYFFIKEMTYIIYYMAEKPQKIWTSSRKGISNVYQELYKIVNNIQTEYDFSIGLSLEKYNFLLAYLVNFAEQNKITSIYVTEKKAVDPYMDDIYDYSNIHEVAYQIRLISQNFCAYILFNEASVFEKYLPVFLSFYHFVNVIEPGILHREIREADLEILREYYDLIRKHMRKRERIISSRGLSILFENYERGLRRIMNETEY